MLRESRGWFLCRVREERQGWRVRFQVVTVVTRRAGGALGCEETRLAGGARGEKTRSKGRRQRPTLFRRALRLGRRQVSLDDLVGVYRAAGDTRLLYVYLQSLVSSLLEKQLQPTRPPRTQARNCVQWWFVDPALSRELKIKSKSACRL